MANSNRCDQCLTQGITIVPMRWGYRFKGKELLEVGRLLREGYVYILDNNGKWYGYVVTEGRYLKQFNVNNAEKTPDLPVVDSTCFKGDNCKALNNFIRIPNPNKDIKTLWLAYSPVKWTKTVIQRHKSNTDDAKTNNMIEVSVSATQSKSTASLNVKGQNAGGYDLLEYDPDGKGKEPITQYYAAEYLNYTNPFTKQPYSPDKTSEKDKLKKELSKVEENGNRVLNVYFNDEVGELIDLNGLMIQAKEKEIFKQGSDEDYKFKTAVAIQSIKPEIIYNGIGSFIDKSTIDARVSVEQADTLPNNVFAGTALGQGILTDKERDDRYANEIANTITYSKKIQAGQKAWGDFEKLLNYKDMQQWLNDNYVPKVNKLNTVLKSIAQKYTDILASDELKREMSFNFDVEDNNSCADYTFIVQQFIGSTASQNEIGNVYNEMLLTQGIMDQKNYLARALLFNKPEALNKIHELDSLSGNNMQGILELSWSTLSAEILGKVRAVYQNKLTLYYGDKIHLSLSEIIFDRYVETRKFTENFNHAGLALSRSDLLMGLFTNKKLAVVTINGTIGSYVKSINNLLNENINSLNGGRGSVSKNDIDKVSKTFVNRMEAEGVLTSKQNPVKLTVFVDKDAITNAKISKEMSLKHVRANYSNLKLSYYTRKEASIKTSKLGLEHKFSMVDAMSQSLGFVSLEEFETLYKSQSSFKGVIKGNFVPTSLQAVACLSLWSAVENSVGDDKIIATQKFSGSVAMLVGGLVQYASDVTQLKVISVAQKSSNSFLNASIKTTLKGEVKSIQYVSTGLKWTARGLTIGGAAIFAYYDVKSGFENREQGEIIMSNLYFGSAATGLISAGFLAWAAISGSIPVIGWAALGLSILIGVTIMWWQKTPLEYWFKYCQWGIDSRWNNADYELKQLNNALKGIDVDATE